MKEVNELTSSCDENTAKPKPVGLCWSGLRKVQKAIGRPPNWVNQLSSSDWVVSWGSPDMCKTLLRSARNCFTSAPASRGWVRICGWSIDG